MAFLLEMGGVDVTEWMRYGGTFRVSQPLGGMSTCDFRLFSADPLLTLGRPVEGKEIILFDDIDGGHTLFWGIIAKVDEVIGAGYETDPRLWEWNVTANDCSQYLDRHRIAITYSDMTPGAMIQDAWAKDFGSSALSSEGITISSVSAGPVISENLVFDYVTFREFMDTLATRVGYSWYVDHQKDLHFEAKVSPDAPFSYYDTSPDIISGSVRVEWSGEEYANRILVRVPANLDKSVTEYVLGAASPNPTYFDMTSPLSATPTILRGSPGVSQTVGVYGTDNDKQWYWLRGSTRIWQDVDASPPLSEGEYLTVTYNRLFDDIIAYQDDAEITARQLLEGGTGVHEIMLDAAEVETRDGALALAEAEVNRRKSIIQRIYYSTRSMGLRPGMLQPVESGVHGLVSDYYLLESIELSHDPDGYGVYRVQAINSGARKDWVRALSYALGNSSSIIAVGDSGTEAEGGPISYAW
jgi:hypothetical protein